MQRKNCNYIFVFLMITFVSCKNNIHEDYHTFKDGLWNTEEPITFKYHISDTAKKYDLSLKIRYLVDYEFQNLIVFLNGIKKDTFEIFLKDELGKPTGTGVSDVREIEYFFDKERVFSKSGDYKIIIEQYMRHGSLARIENLTNILAIGLIVSEHND